MANTYASGNYASNESTLYQRFMSNGFTLAQTCGILANIYHESGFNHTIWSSGSSAWENAYGLCQWRRNRKDELFRLYGDSPDTVDQFNFILYEFNSTESQAYNRIKSITANTRDAAGNVGYYFADLYERCHDDYNEERRETAKRYYDFYSGIDPSTLPTPTTSLESNIPTGNQNISGSTSGISYNGVLSTVDPYAGIVAENLSKVTAAGFDYGYLINMTYGGEFKFYIPEFAESAGANWGDIELPGRSVNVKFYNSTNSRAIQINLDLYAGVGLYNSSTDDVVKLMHDDVNFVKSLEYPDYNESIVRPPATVHLILGSSVNMTGVVSDVSVEHLKPLDSQNRSMYIRLSFTVTQTSYDPPGQSDIRNGISAIMTSSGSMNQQSTSNKGYPTSK